MQKRISLCHRSCSNDRRCIVSYHRNACRIETSDRGRAQSPVSGGHCESDPADPQERIPEQISIQMNWRSENSSQIELVRTLRGASHPRGLALPVHPRLALPAHPPAGVPPHWRVHPATSQRSTDGKVQNHLLSSESSLKDLVREHSDFIRLSIGYDIAADTATGANSKDPARSAAPSRLSGQCASSGKQGRYHLRLEVDCQPSLPGPADRLCVSR